MTQCDFDSWVAVAPMVAFLASYYVPKSTLDWSARYMSHLFGKERST